MAHVLSDRVLEASVSAGAGPFTLAGAVLGFRAFSSVCAVTDTVPYYIEAVDDVGRPTGDYEFGLGTYSAANELTRTTVRGSSNGGLAVVFAAGTKLVGLGVPAPNSPDSRLEWRNSLGLTTIGNAIATAADAAAVRTMLGLDTRLYETGDVVPKARITAPAGWVKANGTTIGSAASGATGRANADTEALFTLLWNEFSQAVLPIQTSAGAASVRGASAAADYAANKRLPVLDLRGEFVRGLDEGRGVDAGRVIGSAQADDFEAHTHSAPVLDSDSGASGTMFGGSGPQIGTWTSGSAGGTETRPRNVALPYYIKL
jgi:hypothetical protein